MKIYTKTGDQGDTSLGSGVRLAKNSARVTAYGEVDELNAVLGLCVALIINYKLLIMNAGGEFLVEVLTELQKDLMIVGADLASPSNVKVGGKVVPRISADHSAKLEKWIDEIEAQLEPLTSFILPGGSTLAAQLHVARAVCRRAERAVVGLMQSEKSRAEGAEVPDALIIYLNRLSDLLFVMARLANKNEKVAEEKWYSGG